MFTECYYIKVFTFTFNILMSSFLQVLKAIKGARSRYFRYIRLILLIMSSKRQIGRARVFHLQESFICKITAT